MILLVAPHPDDIAIALGAFVLDRVDGGEDLRMILATDGSEARLPDVHLPAERGRIRVAEAHEEALRLGLPHPPLLLARQHWFSAHQTPPEALYPDGSLADVSRFTPAPIDDAAIDELRAVAPPHPVTWAAPHPEDKLTMHRIVTAIVQRAARPRDSLLFYECLSTAAPPAEPWTIFGFDESLMTRKCHAIGAHRSMAERRRVFGGYSNPGVEFYDAIVRRENARYATHQFPFGERFQWQQPSS